MSGRNQKKELEKKEKECAHGLSEYICRQKKERESISYQLYEDWIGQNEWDAGFARPLEYEPLISVVIPVYNVLAEQLTECIESVKNQTYQNWELILVDDHSTWECVKETLQRYENTEKITIIYREKNGNISEATNSGLERVKGEFIAFSDCDDVLAINALYEFAKLLNQHPDLDFLYSDEDKLSEDGKRRHSPFFKPDWSPDTFMSMMYTNHLALYRTKLVKKTGGLRSEFNGAQDHDFTLRFMELTDDHHVGHISKVLYHWRERAESTAAGTEVKPYAMEAGKKAREEALKRRGLCGETEFVPEMNQYRVVYRNDNCPLVSIIIPSKDHFELLRQCVDSIIAYTSYPNYEFVIVDNGSKQNVRDIIADYLKDKRAIYHYEKMEFNFSRMCNIGADLSQGEFLLFLNDDMENFQTDWLGRLVGHASLKYVGAVGAKLYYPKSNLIQHAGIVNSEKFGPIGAFAGVEDSKFCYFGRNRMDYNFLAVTGACLMIEKCKYEDCGGFDEELAVAYNDVDLCVKLYEKGYYNVLRNDVILYHHESVSRGMDNQSEEKVNRLNKERTRFYEKHEFYNGRDPFYNINLAGNRNDFWIKESGRKVVSKQSGEKLKRSHASDSMEMHIDVASYYKNQLVIAGWGFERRFSNNNEVQKYLLLESKKDRRENYLFQCKNIYREDVANIFVGTVSNLEICGFETVIPSDILNPLKTDYQISLILKKGATICQKAYNQSLNELAQAQDYLDESSEFVDKAETYAFREDILSDVAVKKDDDDYMIDGWAFCAEDAVGYYKRLVFITPSGYIISRALRPVKRLDIAQRFIKVPYVADSGFHCKVTYTLLDRLEDGTEGGILFINKRNPDQKFLKKVPGLTVANAMIGEKKHV